MKNVRISNLSAYLDAKRGSAKKIALELKIKPSTVSEWKSGRRPVPDEHVPIICQILGVTADDLCKPFNPHIQDWTKTEEGQMLLKVLPKLSDDGLNQVLLAALQRQQSETKQQVDP